MRMTTASKAIVAATLWAFAASAGANWRYAEWGASPKQVVAASHGKAHLITTDHDPGKRVFGGDLEVRATYTDGGVSYQVEFYFKQEHLSAVKLVLKNVEQCEEALMAFRQRLGKPTRKSELGSDIWDRTDSGDRTRAVDLRHESPLLTDCFITYERLAKISVH